MATVENVRLKAIWEPVNVKEDLELTSVHFTSPEEGWVAGGKSAMGGGVILHTADGGKTWQAQLGDPQSSDRAYSYLRFLGAETRMGGPEHGSRRPQTAADQRRAKLVGRGHGGTASRRLPVYVGRDRVLHARQDDSAHRGRGRKWEPVYECRVKAEVGGLTREVACEFEALSFVNPQIGFAISRGIGHDAGFVLAKTEDGGGAWKTSVILPGEDGKEGALHFFDEKTGVLRTINGKLFRTADGGQTWQESPGQAAGKPEIEFADPQVGWMMRYRAMVYTTNGGRAWVSREIAFPDMVNAFCLVRRDSGYAVGNHGMVYRYRVAPADYTAKGMLPAPAMP